MIYNILLNVFGLDKKKPYFPDSNSYVNWQIKGNNCEVYEIDLYLQIFRAEDLEMYVPNIDIEKCKQLQDADDIPGIKEELAGKVTKEQVILFRNLIFNHCYSDIGFNTSYIKEVKVELNGQCYPNKMNCLLGNLNSTVVLFDDNTGRYLCTRRISGDQYINLLKNKELNF
jgi:hypothetical protein